MSCPILDCPSCKHIDLVRKHPHTCKAFPYGIPDNYFWGEIDVRKVAECNNGYRFEDALAD